VRCLVADEELNDAAQGGGKEVGQRQAVANVVLEDNDHQTIKEGPQGEVRQGDEVQIGGKDAENEVCEVESDERRRNEGGLCARRRALPLQRLGAIKDALEVE
jgi:hypothetical protein